MAAGRIIIPNVMPALDINGNPVAGAKLTFYANETTTLQAVYTTSALTVAHPNPITADAAGAFASIFADTDVAYSVAITDADNAPIVGLRNRDNVKASLFFGDDYIDTAALKANNLSDLASASAARTNLGLGSIATQAASAVAITGGSIAGITDLAVADGGTGASSASAARDNLGLTIGTNVQAYDADLTTWAGITPGTGVATALAANVGSAGAFTTFNGAGGTPSSLTLTNATGLPVVGGGTGAATAADARTNLAVVGLTDLAASTGAALVGSIQTGTGAALETVQTVLRRTIYAASYGFATGASAATNTTALQNAIIEAGAQGGGVVIMPPGVFSVNTVYLRSNVTLRGAGLGSFDTNGTTIRGTVLDQATSNAPVIYVLADATYGALRGVQLHDFILRGHASATVRMLRFEAITPYAITECVTNIDSFGGFGLYEAVTGGGTTVYLCHFRMKANTCTDKPFETYGAYNEYDLVANYVAANKLAGTINDQSAVVTSVSDGPLVISGTSNLVYAAVETIYANPSSPWEAAIVVNGAKNTLVRPEVVNCLAARCTASFRVFGSDALILNPQTFGTDYPTYSFEIFSIDGPCTIVGGSVLCTFKLEIAASATDLAKVFFVGNTSSYYTSRDGTTTLGDAAATLTNRLSNGTQIWNTALTADRAVTLSTTGALDGATFRIVRTAAATGAFNLNVGTGPLKALTAGTWCAVTYNGSAWVLTAYGAL